MNHATHPVTRPVRRPQPSSRAERVRNSLIDHIPSTLANFGLFALLSMTPRLIHRAAARTPRLQELLGTSSFVVTITTLQGGGGQLTLRNGQLSFSRSTAHTADLTQTWSSAREALRALTSSDETDLQRAFVAGDLKMRGSFLPVLWLNEALKLARGRDSKQVTRFLSRDAA
ncbi:hypothetical protein AB4Y45_42130 [Paraburkholderia sp. EG287A]|uniref:hypothetical protein n=1 Tax=unclassified Paraburkholderia TaxID=2615204 RepID=UPI0034D2AFA7